MLRSVPSPLPAESSSSVVPAAFPAVNSAVRGFWNGVPDVVCARGEHVLRRQPGKQAGIWILRFLSSPLFRMTY